jgi:DNA replication and repair protein RecF
MRRSIVRVTRLSLRNFRSYEAAEVRLGRGITVVTGPNGAGKTNLLEALYFACTGRSCRTANEREVVRFGAGVARLELDAEAAGEAHRITVGFEPGEAKRLHVDGAPVDRLTDATARPLVSVFLPDRLELVVGAPALRRAHLDQVIAALWPARVGTRRAYSAALAQRNALLGAIRAGRAGRSSLPAWDLELARHGVALAADRAAAAAELARPFAAHAEALGLEGGAEVAYRPRSRAERAEELAAELAERVESDLERGFTGHGPHRDELVLRRAGRELRTYGSRGQQRLGLLALLLAERGVLAAERGAAPLMLLDDVTSELDAERRERLVEGLREGGGQSVIATTDLAHVPGGGAPDVARLAVAEGRVREEARGDPGGGPPGETGMASPLGRDRIPA